MKKAPLFRMAFLFLVLVLSSVTRAQTTSLSDLDSLRYIASHGDLIEVFGADPVKGRSHYEQWGIKEGRQITFEPSRYMASHADLIQAFKGDEFKATTHYIQYGYKERRQTTFSDLDALQYIATYGDLIQAFGSSALSGIRHYVSFGYQEGRRAFFDALAYIASHGDLIAAFGTDAVAGVKHYINWGYKEGRQVVFDALGYLARHTDLQQAFGSDTVAATKHYINWGFKEGRNYALTVSVKVTGPGTASQNRIFLNPGERASVELVPSREGYLEAVTGCGGALNKNTYVIPPITKGCEITATFRIGDGQLFATNPVLTPDLFPKFKALCDPEGKGLPSWVYNINGYTTANIQGHKDGRRDIVVGLWCQPPVGTVVDGPTKSGLLIFVQNADGSFTDATNRLFGVDMVDAAGGVPFRMVASDLNGDGYDEVFVAVTGEDGRTLPNGFTGYNRQNVALTSNSLGGYRQSRVGSPAYNYLVKLVVGSNRSIDVLTDTIGFGGRKHAFRLNTDQWVETNEYDGIPRFEYSFSSSQGKGGTADFAIGFGGTDPAKTEQFLYKRVGVGAGWSLVDSKLFALTQKTDNLKTWNGDPGSLYIYTFSGVDYSFVQFADNCEVAESVGSSYSLFAVSAQKIIGGHAPSRSYTEGDPKDFEWSMLMFGYDVSNEKITEKQINMRNFIASKKFYTLACDDFTGDGSDDLFISNWGTGEKPDIYVNQYSGEFALVDSALLPTASTDFNGAHAIFEDVDGDRYNDLVYFMRGIDANAKSIRLQIFRGIRGITSNDLKRN